MYAIIKFIKKMKKLIITLSIVFLFAVTAIAQPKAIGLRLGWNWEASYQHSLGEKAFLQLDLGTYNFFRGLSFSPTFNFSIAKPNWTPKGEWEFYAGPGLSTGYYFGDLYLYDIKDKRRGDYFYLGLSGMFGLSYTFWFPLQLSVDLRPTVLGFNTAHHWDKDNKEHNVSWYSDFFYQNYYDGKLKGKFLYPNVAISARYAFGK